MPMKYSDLHNVPVHKMGNPSGSHAYICQQTSTLVVQYYGIWCAASVCIRLHMRNKERNSNANTFKIKLWTFGPGSFWGRK